jgi:hypothetical protein
MIIEYSSEILFFEKIGFLVFKDAVSVVCRKPCVDFLVSQGREG